MALYGTQRDISLFRHLNRELMGDIITQQCAFYKFKIEEIDYEDQNVFELLSQSSSSIPFKSPGSNIY